MIFYLRKWSDIKTHDIDFARMVLAEIASPIYHVDSVSKGKTGAISVIFNIDAEDGDKIVTNAYQKLHRLDFSKIETQWPYMKEPSSHSQGWVKGAPDLSGETKENTTWSGSWRSREGGVLTLVLSRYLKQGKFSEQWMADVHIVYCPSIVVKRMENVVKSGQLDQIIQRQQDMTSETPEKEGAKTE